MTKTLDSDKKPLVGFFPLTYNLAETGRAILVAKRYTEMGGNVVFFSHRGRYDYLIKKFGFKLRYIKPFYNEKMIDEMREIFRREKKGIMFKESFLRESAKEEIKTYNEAGIKLIVSFVNTSSHLSARIAKIPVICIAPESGTFYLSIPDNYENKLTYYLIPQFIKTRILNCLFGKGGKSLKPFNKIIKEHNSESFKTSIEAAYGDVTLSTNFLELINIFPKQQKLPDENYTGIILLDELFQYIFLNSEKQKINNKIKNHLNSKEKSIILSMGSSGDKKLFIKLLKILNKSPYRIVCINSNILDENEIPSLNENILFLNHIPSIFEISKKVDLSIIHGGQGTVYNAVYAGRPIIGFPMQFEQHLNLEKIVGHGSGIMLSRKFFNEKKFLQAINDILTNYDKFLLNAYKLSKKLPKSNGDMAAARRINEIINKLTLN